MAEQLPKPGCFGSVMVRAQSHNYCKTCPHTGKCGVVARKAAPMLAKRLGADHLPSTVKRRTTTQPVKASAARIAGMSAKGQSLYESLVKQGVNRDTLSAMLSAPRDERANLLATLNLAYLARALDALAEHRRMTKQALRQTLENELGWGSKTAASHVSILANLLCHMGLTENTGQELVVI